MAARRLANPWTINEYPTNCERVLKWEDWTFTCQAFNSRGTYLACGTAEGHVVVWDFATLSPALVIHNLHRDYLNSLTWVSKTKGRVICTTSSDGTVKLFDLELRKVVRELKFGKGIEVNGASTHPKNPDFCLVCLSEDPDDSDGIPWPRLHDLGKNGKLKCRYLPNGPEGKNVEIATHKRCSGIVATFSKRGQCVFVGGQGGNVLVFSTEDSTLLSVVIPPSMRASARGWIVGLTLSRNGKVLLVDSGGKTIAVYDVARDEARPEQQQSQSQQSSGSSSNTTTSTFNKTTSLPADVTLEMVQDAMRWRVGKILRFKRFLEDVVGNTKWADVTTSWSEFVLAASSTKDVHELFVWDVSGSLVAVLKDSENASGHVRGAAWHPWRPIVTTITGSGDVCLWTNKGEKNWVAFAPGFQEIEENVVYQEKPDEFDPERLEKELKLPTTTTTTGDGGGGGNSLEAINIVEPDPGIFSEDEEADEMFTQNKGYFISSSLPIEVKLNNM
jgi:COMPASS component SWD1